MTKLSAAAASTDSATCDGGSSHRAEARMAASHSICTVPARQPWRCCFIPNLELQASFFLDENILSNMSDLNRFSNKTAWQVGAYWYTPINDLAIVGEYTRIRPFVYTHTNPKNTYTSWNDPIGHPIGPNADQIWLKAEYAFFRLDWCCDYCVLRCFLVL